MKNKIHNLLNKNIKEFNRPVLFLLCLLFLVIVGLISYSITAGSFAFFSFNIDGTKSLTGTYAVTPGYVYAYHEDSHYLGQPVTGGEKTGYCAIDDTTGECVSMLYSALADCNTANSGKTCEAKTVNYLRTDYTYNYAKLEKTFFYRHNINSNYEITSTDVCYIMSNNLRCLLGGDPMQYTTNKETLQNSFGSGNCTNNSDSYECTTNGLTAIVNTNGNVSVEDSNIICEFDSGASHCGQNNSNP